MKKINGNEEAVSELLGTMLLLLIAVSVFTYIAFQVASDDGPEPQTHVNIYGDIIKQNITLTNMGGESIDGSGRLALDIAGNGTSSIISKYLDDTNHNGLWDFGEKIIFNFLTETNTSEDYFLDHIDKYESIDALSTDILSNEIKFNGPVFSNYRSDIGIHVTISDTTPHNDDYVTITISVWCYGGDVQAAGDVYIKCPLPEGLQYVPPHVADKGSYDPVSGLWHIGNMLVENDPINLTIRAKVVGVPIRPEYTQLGLILEGSNNMLDSQSHSVWQSTLLNGINMAIKKGNIPHDETVELTIVGYGHEDPPRAYVILDPTVLDNDTYKDIQGGGELGIRNDKYPEGFAPMSSAIRLIADEMRNSDFFSQEKKQFILLIGSGKPDCIWIPDYNGEFKGYTLLVQDDTIGAAEYLNTTLFNEFNLVKNNDEFNAMIVAKSDIDRNPIFINNSIVMPQPNCCIYTFENITENPIDEEGWVLELTKGWQEFQAAFDYIISILFHSIHLEVNLEQSTTLDPFDFNNTFEIYITPQG